MMVGEIDYGDIIVDARGELNENTGAPFLPIPEFSAIIVFFFCMMVSVLLMNLLVSYLDLLYRQECFNEKYTTRKTHTKLHPAPKWRIFNILNSEDIDVRRHFLFFCGYLCKQSVKNGEQ